MKRKDIETWAANKMLGAFPSFFPLFKEVETDDFISTGCGQLESLYYNPRPDSFHSHREIKFQGVLELSGGFRMTLIQRFF
jgi:hypothetical protein